MSRFVKVVRNGVTTILDAERIVLVNSDGADGKNGSERCSREIRSCRTSRLSARPAGPQAGSIAGAAEAHRKAAGDGYTDLAPIMRELRANGHTQMAIADELNKLGAFEQSGPRSVCCKTFLIHGLRT